MWPWVLEHPEGAATVLAATLAVMAGITRFAFTRHREYIAFSAHMKKEEEHVWPEVMKAISDLEAIVQKNHGETLHTMADHGERIARVEAKMGDGQIDNISRMLKTLLGRPALGKPTGG